MKPDDPLFVDPDKGLEQLTAPPKEGKRPRATQFPAPKIGIVLLCLIVVVTLFIYRPAFHRTPAADTQGNTVIERGAPVAVAKAQVLETDTGIVIPLKLGQEAMITINKSQWIGASCYDPHAILVGQMLTRDVSRLVRLNGDDKLTSLMDPAGWTRNVCLNGPDTNIKQYKIPLEDPSETAKMSIRAMTEADFKELLAAQKALATN